MSGSRGGQGSGIHVDLARSVVYTTPREPGLGWTGTRRRCADFVLTTCSSRGSSTDWVDTSKIAIPQADEQQRLLANMITQMARDRKPIPRLWYLPFGKRRRS